MKGFKKGVRVVVAPDREGLKGKRIKNSLGCEIGTVVGPDGGNRTRVLMDLMAPSTMYHIVENQILAKATPQRLHRWKCKL